MTPQRGRRLQDLLLATVHRACDDGRLALAARLLHLGEEAFEADPDPRRRQHAMAALVAAHERLWLLRHLDRPE